MCEQRRLWRACVSAQAGHSLCCSKPKLLDYAVGTNTLCADTYQEYCVATATELKCPRKRAVRNTRWCQFYQSYWHRSLLYKLHLSFYLYTLGVSSEGCGEPVQVHMLATAFTARSLSCSTMRLVPIATATVLKCPRKRAVMRNTRWCQSYQCKWHRSLLCKLCTCIFSASYTPY